MSVADGARRKSAYKLASRADGFDTPYNSWRSIFGETARSLSRTALWAAAEGSREAILDKDRPLATLAAMRSKAKFKLLMFCVARIAP